MINIKTLLTKFLIIILWCFAFSSFAQVQLSEQYSFRRYTTQDGLPENQITSIYQDEKGFLWVGTSNGFARFDGFSFRSWQPKIKVIEGVRKGLDGKPVFYTNSNISKLPFWNKDSVTTYYQLPDSFFTNYGNCKGFPPQYSIWQSRNYEKRYFVEQTKHNFEVLFQIPIVEEIGDLPCCLDTSTSTLYLPYARRVFGINIHTKESFYIENLDAYAIFKHHKLGILAINEFGIYKIENNKSTKLLSYNFEYGMNFIDSKSEELYIFDFNNIYSFHDGKITKLAEISAITDAIFDRDGNLWVTSNTGLYAFFQFDFKNYQLTNANKGTVVGAFSDNNNNKWFSSSKGILYHFDSDNRLKKIKQFHFPFLNGVFESGDVACFSYGGGVAVLKDKQCSTFNLSKLEIVTTRISPLRNGNLITTMRAQGVIEFSTNKKIVRRHEMSLVKQRALNAIERANGDILVAGSKGITVIKGDSSILIPNERGTICRNFAKDKKENIFVSNGDYLCLFKNNQLIDIGYFKGDFINDLLVTQDQILVIAAAKGLHLLDLNNFDETKKQVYIKYDHQNGVTMLIGLIDALFEDCFGRVWMPCTDGVVQFIPNKLLRNLSAPRLYINAFSFSKDNVHLNEITEFENIKLKHNQQNIAFDFIGLLFSAASNVRYYYRLVGFQDEWNQTQERRISFNNLPPGKYTFELYADAGTENSKTEIQQLPFEIVPAFWQTAWFFVASIFLLLLLTTGITTYIIRKNYYKKTAKMRAEFQLNELRIKSIRLKSIPHFNANVLAAIEYYIMNISKEEANVLLNKYALFTNQTLKDVERPSRSLKEELEYVKLYLELEKLRFRDKFIYEVNIDNEVDTESVSLPTMLLHTFAENALKHGFVGKTSGFLLKIGAMKKEKSVLVFVEDNGVGRKAATDNPIKQSTKQGLAILYQQIEIINQLNENKINYQFIDLVDENDVALGTRFEIEIPYNYKYI